MTKKTTIGIIGYGRFGRLWASCLKKFGAVLVYDKKITKGDKMLKFVSLPVAASADILFLLVPISELESCCKQIVPFLSRRTIVADACSVKEYPARIMKKFLPAHQPIIATHPLFGPDSVARLGLAQQKIVVAPLRASRTEKNIFSALLRKLKLKIIFATPAEHDRQMASSQALVHFIGRGLRGLGLQEQEISTPDYHQLLRMKTLVENDTDQLFLDMHRYNRFARTERRKFLRNLQNLEIKINSSGRKDLTTLRMEIDELDLIMMRNIAKRLAVARSIGQWKKKNNLGIFDKGREKELRDRRGKLATALKLDKKLMEKIFKLLILKSRKIQK